MMPVTRFVAVVCFGLLSFGLTACSSSVGATPIDGVSVDEAVDWFDCASVEPVNGDPQLPAKVAGFDCYVDGRGVLFRVIPDKVWRDHKIRTFGPVLSAEQAIVVGADWFAVGPPSSLNALPDKVSGAQYANSAADLAAIESVSRAPLSAELDDLVTCRTFFATSMDMYLQQPDSYPSQADGLEGIYPGFNEIMAPILQKLDENSDTLRRLFDEELGRYDNIVVTYMGAVDAFCEAVPKA